MSESDSDDDFADNNDINHWGLILQLKEIYKATKYSMFWTQYSQYSQDPKDDMLYLQSMIEEGYFYKELFDEYEHSLDLELRCILSSNEARVYKAMTSYTTNDNFKEHMQSALKTYKKSNK